MMAYGNVQPGFLNFLAYKKAMFSTMSAHLKIDFVDRTTLVAWSVTRFHKKYDFSGLHLIRTLQTCENVDLHVHLELTTSLKWVGLRSVFKGSESTNPKYVG